MDKVDCIVIGAGVVGLAIARSLGRRGLDVVVVERNRSFGQETSSRNSEVIHAGIYYPAGSLKAQLCIQGRDLLYAYARDKGIEHAQLGKLIVAVTPQELPVVKQYAERARQCGAGALEYLQPSDVHELEPDIVCAGAVLSPHTGIVDSHELMLSLVGDIEAGNGVIAYNTRFERASVGRDGSTVTFSGSQPLEMGCRLLVNCAGLNASRVAGAIRGLDQQFVPRTRYAQGHYYSLVGRSPFRRLIYPIADAGGLGIHVTLDTAGQARFGPDVRWRDSIDYAFDDTQRPDFLAAIRRYYPAIDEREIAPAYTGIRPKIVGPGSPPADFLIQGDETHGIPGLVNLFGIESPGLTAALAIGEHVSSVFAPGCRPAGVS